MMPERGPWWPARRRLGLLAVGTAVLAGAVLAVLGGSPLHAYGAALYVAVTTVALFAPGALALPVVMGVLLIGSVSGGPGGLPPLVALPLIGGVVASAELLGGVARLNIPIQRDPGAELRRAGWAALVGGGVFGAAALIGGLPGPSDLLALALATGACVTLAALLVKAGV